MFDLAERAVGTLTGLLRAGRPLSVSWSAGKDSSAALNLVLVAAARMRADGETVPPIVISHSDTLIENPEIAVHARAELDKVRAFADEHELDVRIHIATPSHSQAWVFRTIGQGKLPTFPGDPRECSVEFKVKPQARALKGIMKELEAETGRADPVVIIGTRFSESPDRLARMRERGESPHEPWEGSHGFSYLSPVAEWTIEDVWAYLGVAADMALIGGDTGDFLAYSDFSDTLRIYAAATGSSCGVAGDRSEASVKRSEACGARFGCYLCTAVGQDKSLETMIEGDDRYAYMRGLNRLQRFLLATRWDWSRRNWLGRTINEAGYQRLQPDTYSPAMVEELLRYCLTLDAREAEASAELGVPARFQMVSAEMLVAIDAEWSRYGLHRPFHALKIFTEVRDGARYDVPVLEEIARTPRPAARFAHVGRDWDEGQDWQFTGLRTVWEMFDECPAFQTTTLKGDQKVWDVNVDARFHVDPESALLVLILDADRLIREYHDDPGVGITQAYEIYLSLGTVSLSSRQRKVTDHILRRTAFRARHGMAGPDVDVQALLDDSISASEMKGILQEMHTETVAEDMTAEEPVSEITHLPESDETEGPEQLTLLLGAA